MRLWVDADRPAPRGFDKWVKTAWDAIDELSSGKYEYVSLNYNLGNMKDNGDGYMIACWMEKQTIDKKLPRRIGWNCHSLDGHGKKMISSALRHADAIWDKLI